MEKTRKEHKILVHNPLFETCIFDFMNYVPEHIEQKEILADKDFWKEYDDGWNGSGLKQNRNVKVKGTDKVYCHNVSSETLQKLYDKYTGSYARYDFDETPKDIREGNFSRIRDVQLLGGDELLVCTASGNAVVINLSKENRFFEAFGRDKADFKENVFDDPQQKASFLQGRYYVEIDDEKHGNLYNGLIYKTKREFMHQIELGDKADKAYIAHVDNLNRGGYIVTVQGIHAFLPGSQAATNKITNFEELLDKNLEVMIEGFDPKNGFVVSRKKYLAFIKPELMERLKEIIETEPDKKFTGKITGFRHFGIFVEFSQYYTGLIYKNYASEELYAKLMEENIDVDSEIDVYINDIQTDDYGNERIVLTDIPPENRKKIIAEREEKIRAEEIKSNIEEAKKIRSSQNFSFSGKTISSFDELHSINEKKGN